MKKFYLQKVEQNQKEFYCLITDPRIIVKLIQNANAGEIQEIQRPWNVTRVKEVARYVAGKFKDVDNKKSIGLIPNAPIINIKNKLTIEEDEKGYYVNLPTNKREFEEYKECLEILDGQHRVRAFMDEYIDPDFDDNKMYNMIFSLFYKMSEKEKKEIFMITNEKQEKVQPNLLRLYKYELELLNGDEDIYELDLLLNKEDYSPLKGRIIIGADNIPKGYKENQIAKIIKKSGSYAMFVARGLSDDIIAKTISNYLNAWEIVYGVSFSDPQNDTLTKISGIRYIIYLLPCCMEILASRNARATVDEFKKIIEMLPAATGIEDVFTNERTTLSFRGEGATTKLAKDHELILKAYDERNRGEFNVFEGI